MSSQVSLTRDRTVAIIELRNPPKNYMTWRMVDELDELTLRLESDDSVRAIVLTGGVPGRFITHFDVREELDLWRGAGPIPKVTPSLARVGASAGRLWRRLAEASPPLARSVSPLLGRFKQARLLMGMVRVNGVLRRLERMGKAVIAALGGHAIGAGCELALACDFRFMARGDFQVGLSEVILGVLPGAGGVQRLVRIVGMRHARTLLLDGRHIGPDEAEKIGLVHSLHEPEDLLPFSVEYAAMLATRSPAAIGRLKRSLLQGGELGQAVDAEQTLVIEHGIRPEALRALERYAEMLDEGRMGEAEIFEQLRRGEAVKFEE